MGTAICSTRRWVMICLASAASPDILALPLRHHKMPCALRKQARPIVLPALHMHAGIAPPGPIDPGPCIGITRQARAQVVDGKINGLGQARQVLVVNGLGINLAAFNILPQVGPAKLDDRGDFQKGSRGPAMDRYPNS